MFVEPPSIYNGQGNAYNFSCRYKSKETDSAVTLNATVRELLELKVWFKYDTHGGFISI